jgi:geranylgeranyl diphosphate synthase type I
MNLVQVIHRLATDSTFAAQFQDEYAATMSGNTLDQDSIEAFQAVLKGPQAWQELCNPCGTGMEGFWEASTSATDAADEPAQAPARSYDQMLAALSAPQPAEELSLRALPTLCCQALDVQPQQTQQLSAAWNTLYTALHLLDNIEDGDTPNQVWAAWGAGPTLNFTTGLLASIGLTLDELVDLGATPQVSRALQRDFNRTILGMCAGQHDDLTLQQPTLEQCWTIAEAKSSIFFALACRSAATLAGADVERTQQFEAFGRHLGVLVQITDDISGLWSWEHASSDLGAEQRWTLPTAYAMSALGADERARLQTLLSDAASPDAEEQARQMIIAAGAVLYLATEAQRRYHAALRLLEQMTAPSAVRETLRELLHQAAPMTINQTPVRAAASPAAQPARREAPAFMMGRETLLARTA